MSPDLWAALGLQTVIIIIAIIAAIRHSEQRLSTLETKVAHNEVELSRLPQISRAVARIEGKLAK